LFDLNGVLTDHTPAREEGRYKVGTRLMLAVSCAVHCMCSWQHTATMQP
jgi:hypothetical protein